MNDGITFLECGSLWEINSGPGRGERQICYTDVVVRLNLEQRRILGDFFNNLAVAWFAAGVISTVFVRPQRFWDILVNVALGLMFGMASLTASLFVVSLKKR